MIMSHVTFFLTTCVARFRVANDNPTWRATMSKKEKRVTSEKAWVTSKKAWVILIHYFHLHPGLPLQRPILNSPGQLGKHKLQTSSHRPMLPVTNL